MAAPAGQNYMATGMPHVVESSHREKLAKVFNEETLWLCTSPMCCGGCGFGPIGSPLCMGDHKFCCLESEAYTEDLSSDYGVCFNEEKICCCITHCAIPPGGGRNDGVPLFACCNMRWGGGEDGEVILEKQAQLMKKSFLLYYFCCFGCGLVSCSDPIIMGSQKFCCLREKNTTSDCFPSDRPVIYNKSKICCMVEACSFPCCGGYQDGVPGCAVCGNVLFGASSPAPEQQPLPSAPPQAAMY
eukprot:TRINITY_DN24651_c0_g1_i1.p1 TRINITY_DN24651_c0_g1~~TRINITY_DN24651_c0_g1_i1.p1  ORF type:complete len:243 (+),score=55.44 TRINITY_DN24651_c0_g1_i1:79-807(+)